MERTGFRFGTIRTALAEEGNVLTVPELCDIAGVSRSGYYGWVKAEQARQDRDERDKADFQLILNAYRFRGYEKGVRGIHMRLLHIGIRMNPFRQQRNLRGAAAHLPPGYSLWGQEKILCQLRLCAILFGAGQSFLKLSAS